MRYKVFFILVAFTLGLVSGLIPADQSQAAAGPLKFKPIRDARNQQSLPSSNFGSTQTLWAGTGSVSWVTFKVAGIGTASRPAKLRLYVKDASPNTVKIRLASNCYQEETSIWGGLNDSYNPFVSYSFTPSQINTWVEVPVGNVSGDQTLNYALTEGGSDMAKFGSRESATPPELVFASKTDTLPPTAQLTQPAADSVLSGTVDLLTTASDNTEITKVEFFKTNALIGFGVKTAEGYTLPWNTTTAANGLYTLKARVTDSSGLQYTSKYNVTVNNTGPVSTPAAGFSLSNSGSTAPVTLSLTNTSSNATRYSWDFGDGQTSVLKNPPPHVYTQPGNYQVQLTVSNSLGSNSTTQPVAVSEYNRPGRLAGATRLLIIGDSISSTYCTMAVNKLSREGYAVTVIPQPGKGLLSNNPDQLPRLQAIVDAFDPDKTVIEYIGNYDQSNSLYPTIVKDTPELLATWQQRAAAMTEAALSRDGRVWWMDHYFIDPAFSQGVSADEHRTGYHQLHSTYPELGYIDAYYPFGGSTPDYGLRYDGLHPNGAGSALLSNLVRDVLMGDLPDTMAPSAPVLSGSLNGSQPKLNWTYSTDSTTGVVGYKIFRGGLQIATSVDPATLTFTDNSAPQGATSNYLVKAYDGAGNQTSSNQVSIFVP